MLYSLYRLLSVLGFTGFITMVFSIPILTFPFLIPRFLYLYILTFTLAFAPYIRSFALLIEVVWL